MKTLVAALVLFVSTSAFAEDKVLGTLSAGAQKVTLGHGLATLDKKGTLGVRFLGAAPNEKEQARALSNSGQIFGVFDAPNAIVELSFKEGAQKADRESFESCHVGFYRFDIGIYDWSGFSGQCGVVELSGDLKPGAIVHGKLKGRAEGFPDKSGKPPVYTWDVDFTATVRAKP
jgi:hypothetical protein